MRIARRQILFLSLTVFAAVSMGRLLADDNQPATADVFAKKNLVAWCIVPFDGKKRGPEQRAAMLDKLEFTSLHTITEPSISPRSTPRCGR